MTITLPYRDRDVRWAPMGTLDPSRPEAASEPQLAARGALLGAHGSDGRPCDGAKKAAGAGGWLARFVSRRAEATPPRTKRVDIAFAAIDWDYAFLCATIWFAALVTALSVAVLGWGLVAVLIGSDQVLPPAIVFSIQQMVHAGADGRMSG